MIFYMYLASELNHGEPTVDLNAKLTVDLRNWTRHIKFGYYFMIYRRQI